MHSDSEEIKNRLNIIDVLGEYIRLEKTGSNYRALCPFHNEKSPSFMVSEEKQIWHCFGCQKGGDIFGFVMEMEGLGFRDALKMLAEKAGVQLTGYNPQKVEETVRTLEILELATKWYEHQLWSGPGKTKILDYLHSRGLTDETIKDFRLGYAPKGWRNIMSFLLSRGFKIDEIIKTGLLVKKDDGADHYDRFRERIMFPIMDYSGKVVGYSARVAPGGDEKTAKYVNTPETEVYHKSRILYGLDKAKGEIKKKDFVLLVEGNMDVIAASQAGIKNVVAVSGTALTPEQVKIIKRYTPKVKMFFDMDSAGQVATKKSIKLSLANDLEVDVVSISAGKDAADMARENPKELIHAVENSQNAMDYLLEDSLKRFDKNNSRDKRKISELLLSMVASMASMVEKNHWIKKIAERLETTEAALTETFKKVNLKDRWGKNEEEKEITIISRKKIDVLADELIGLILTSSDIWKEASRRKAEISSGLEDSLLNMLLKLGHQTNFSREKFLGTVSDLAIRDRAEKLYFEKKYCLGLNNELEEREINDPSAELANILGEMRKEVAKERLNRIISDLRLAEEKRDKEAVNYLRLEFKKILEEANPQTKSLPTEN